MVNSGQTGGRARICRVGTAHHFRTSAPRLWWAMPTLRLNMTISPADPAGQLVFLGTGTSVGVPVIGCRCAVCRSTDPRDNRTRCGLVLGLPGGKLLVDTPPDLRTQLLREQIDLVHSVLYTHE